MGRCGSKRTNRPDKRLANFTKAFRIFQANGYPLCPNKSDPPFDEHPGVPVVEDTAQQEKTTAN